VTDNEFEGSEQRKKCVLGAVLYHNTTPILIIGEAILHSSEAFEMRSSHKTLGRRGWDTPHYA